ncbi:MAG: DNA repair protein RadA [Clostridiales bacterium]|nr:DNA repair protein RadA [Clostridiales bacterium]
MKQKTIFFCSECGAETAKWQGKCPACGAWNTMEEAPVQPAAPKGAARKAAVGPRPVPKRLNELDEGEELRFSTGISEFDRVLGGGAVRGSVVLVGGAPGIGKSTLLLQMCGLAQQEKILYVTGEESCRQLKMRAKRLGVASEQLFILSETNLTDICTVIDDLSPTLVIIDSVQTMYAPELASAAGSVPQVKECAMSVMRLAKVQGFTAFLVGHVNKDGAIAGPRVLEHMVDCVLYFEGERTTSFRLLRAAKNRFGSTNELGVFEMAERGLRGVENPSEMLLSGRPGNAPGTCVACIIEGTRPLLAEVQALVTPSGFNVARRNSNGLDYNRAMLLLAVLEKRGGLALGGCDAYINVIGGLTLDEPAADLAAVLAIASSARDIPLGNDLAAVGEVGLTGEIRSVTAINQRLTEIARLGLRRCVIPAHIRSEVACPDKLTLIPVKNIREALAAVLS